jgi:mycoredoxin
MTVARILHWIRKGRRLGPMADQIIMYGTTWCGDTRRARRILDENQIPYQWIDIDQDMEGRKFVESVNRGFRSVPTIIFPDGSMLVEPGTNALKEKLGLV